MDTKQKLQQEALQHLHGVIGEEWGKKRLPILHALEDALQAMAEYHPDLDREPIYDD